ncbi:MAG: DUF975 family protein [Oscillospiraceae bacterium]
MYNRKAFKQQARQFMRASVPHFMLVALVYYLLTTGLRTAANWLAGDGTFGVGVLSLFLTILVSLFSIVMGVGFSNYALRLARREGTGVGSLFHAFSFAGRSLGATLLTTLFIFLWTLLIVVGFAVLVGLLTLIAEDAFAVFVAAVVVLYIVMMVLIVAITLRYSMVSFALADDPDAGAMEAIRRSVRMMRGYKGKFFVLELSFIGWELLVGLIAAVIVGVGFAVSGTTWLFQAIMSAGDDIWEVYSLVGNLTGQMAVWTLLAELVSLPLNLWLMVYEQTAAARFYNYVSGYDYHQYMNGQAADPGAPLTPPVQEQPQQPAAPSEPEPSDSPKRTEEPEQPPTPPDGYYNSILPPEPPAGDPDGEEEI